LGIRYSFIYRGAFIEHFSGYPSKFWLIYKEKIAEEKNVSASHLQARSLWLGNAPGPAQRRGARRLGGPRKDDRAAFKFPAAFVQCSQPMDPASLCYR